MAASIEDVAREAGVSVATVSRALRGLPNVAPSTRDRVRQVADRLHYVPHPHAARLATRRSATVGVVVPVLAQWYYAQLFSGAEGALVAAGYDIIPFVVGGTEVRDRFVARMPFRKRVDGLVVADVSFESGAFVRLVEEVPVVTLGVEVQGLPSLAIDNVAAAGGAADHLLDLGHTELAVLSQPPDDSLHFDAPQARRRGVEEALARRGLELDPDLVLAGNFSFRGGAEAMNRLLDEGTVPTAVFAFSDEMAIGAMQAARRRGWAVPEQISVVGFDDHDVSEHLGLTTVRQDVVLQGEMVVDRLLQCIEADRTEPSGAGDDHEQMPTELVVRETTAEPRD